MKSRTKATLFALFVAQSTFVAPRCQIDSLANHPPLSAQSIEKALEM